LKGFFLYYSETFDWLNNAVSVRLALTQQTKQGAISKLNLGSPVTKEQWYIEDPFDLRHNLGSNCTKDGRQRILDMMKKALRMLDEGPNSVESLYSRTPSHFLLKCRVHQEKVSLAEFKATVGGIREVREPFTVHFPQPCRFREVADAFLIFKSEETRRAVHRLNESALGDWQLRLLPCSTWALEDALSAGEYEEVIVAPSSEASAEKVRSGLREASTIAEFQSLIRLAQVLNLKHEETLGKKRLAKLQSEAKEATDAAQLQGRAPDPSAMLTYQ